MDSDPRTFQNLRLNPCEKCVPFPMIKIRDIEDHYKSINKSRGKKLSNDPKALGMIVALSVSQMFKKHSSEILTSDQIKARVPVCHTHPGGRLANQDDPSRVVEMPLYQCQSCLCFYALLQDFRDGAKKLDATYSEAQLTDKDLSWIYVQMMKNFFNTTPYLKAEMYVFMEFVVMNLVEMETQQTSESPLQSMYQINVEADAGKGARGNQPKSKVLMENDLVGVLEQLRR